MMPDKITISYLLNEYRTQSLTPDSVVDSILQKIETNGVHPIWIRVLSKSEIQPYLDRLKGKTPAELPLFGIPFAIKDNIDLAGIPTTAACPDFAYTPKISATVVQKLIDAGAIPIGKTNLDQFATGLVGVRSPYGVCSSVFNSKYISGGSSSGSAVSLAQGLVAFALGTDTAGSGRVPAAFNHLVGFKPTRGLWSTHGLVPACRTLDCITVFTHTVDDAALINSMVAGVDVQDPYSRKAPSLPPFKPLAQAKIGIPKPSQLQFFGDPLSEACYKTSIQLFRDKGVSFVEIDFEPFAKVASMLYRGPWVAERYAAIKSFIETSPEKMNPTVRAIIEGARNYTAADTFSALYELESYRRIVSNVWTEIDALLLPTAPTHYTIEEVEANPIQLNSNLGTYTNFVNLLDLCALAVPSGMRSDGLPFGVTWMAPAFREAQLLEYTGASVIAKNQVIHLAVVGAHLTGEPLHSQLLERKARFALKCKTAPCYRFYALKGGGVAKPGLIREEGFQGPGIDVEVWALDSESFGSFTALVPSPLGIGNVQLEDSTWVKGFICEPFAIVGCPEITSFGGWKSYRKSLA